MEEIYTTLDLDRLASDSELKACLLEMLQEFDGFCKKHDLTYYLSGGTLLGAVRHKGFIPWDDDIDVNMPRPDCEKLMLLSKGRIGKFTLVPPNNACPTFAYHWKLYGDDILVSRRVDGKKSGIGKKIYPAFMDIFPIEGLPSDYTEAVEHYAEIKRIKRKARFQAFLPRYSGRHPIRKMKFFLARLYFRFFAVTNYHDEVIKLAKSHSFEESEHVGVMMTDVHGIVERVEKSEYTPVTEMEFEGKPVRGPMGFNTYLEQLYGPNYMTVLPPHQQFSRHSLVPFIRKKTAEISRPPIEEVEDDSADESTEI
jgi:lipopolysaccharide cholinephosphotransferase